MSLSILPRKAASYSVYGEGVSEREEGEGVRGGRPLVGEVGFREKDLVEGDWGDFGEEGDEGSSVSFRDNSG